MSDATVTSLISLLAIASVEFLVVGILVFALLGLFKQISPKWRRVIWLLAMSKPLVTVVTGSFGGLLHIPLPLSDTLVGSILLPIPAAQASAEGEYQEAHMLLHLATYVWLGGAIFLLIRVWLGATGSRQLVDECLVKGYTLKPGTLKRLDPQIELPENLRVIATPEDAGPAALGVFHPAIIIPESLLPWVVQHRDPTPQERSRFCQVLRHELAHVVNHDTIISIVAAVMRSIFWFHPTAYVAYRRVRMNNELLCDQEVVASGVAPKEYADTLLDMIVGRFSRSVIGQSILGDVTPKEAIRQRVNRLMTAEFGILPKRQVWAYVILGFLAIGLPRFVSTAPAGYVDIKMVETGEIKRVAIADLDQYSGRAIVLTRGVVMPAMTETAEPEMMYANGADDGSGRKSATGAGSLSGVLVAEAPEEEVGPTAPEVELGPLDQVTAQANPEDVPGESTPETLPEKKKPSRPRGAVDLPAGGQSGPILPLNK
jgi:beta-lactamase regulating signal transducer with metallopeptidase domain